MKIRLKIENFILAFVLILPLQDTLRTVLHLPAFLLLIYVFLIFAGGYLVIKQPTNFKKYTKSQMFLISIFILFILEMIISGILNFDSVNGKHIQLIYYVTRYKPFWDEPIMSFLFAGIIRPFVYFTFTIFLIKFLNTEQKINKLIKSLIFLGFISSLYAIYQFIAFKFGLPFASLFSGHDGQEIISMGIRRCEGIFYEPGPHAAFLSVIFVFLIFQLQNKNWVLFKKRILYTMTIVVTIALFLTLSPIGILTPFFVAGVLFYKKFMQANKRKKITLLAIFLIVFPIIFSSINIFKFGENKFSVYQYIGMRLYNTFINNEVLTGDSRVIRSEFGIKLFKDHKLIGVGPGNDGYYFSEYMPYAMGKMGDKNVVANNNLKIIVDTGIIGVLFYILILSFPFVLFFRCKYSKRKNLIISEMCLTVLLFFILISFNAGLYFYQPLFWITYSISIANLYLKNDKLLTG